MNFLPTVLFTSMAATLATVASPTGVGAGTYVEGQVLVTFKPWQDYDTVKGALNRHSLKFSRHFGVISARRLKQTGVVNDDSRSTAELITILKADPAIESVEPDYIRRMTALPNDPSFENLWALRNVGQWVNGTSGAPGADMKFLPSRALLVPSAPVPVVGVMDTGIDRFHPDLVNNLWANPGEIPFNGIDDDGNGKIDDAYGFDFTTGTSNTSDSGEHGTHVAGVIAATGDNQIGIIGANSQARVMVLKVSPDGENISVSEEIAAIQYAVLMKSRGVNLVALNASFAGPTYSEAELDAIQVAGNAGIIVCAAAGNNSTSNDLTPAYPACYRLPNMIVVAASTQSDGLASFSNYGATTVDLTAPGVNIFSTRRGSVTTTLTVGLFSYPSAALRFSGTSPGVEGAVVDCGNGSPEEFLGAVSGNIALIQRGALEFRVQVANAMAAGASAVIIYNDDIATDNQINTFSLGGEANWIPACAVSSLSGLTIKSLFLFSGTLIATRSEEYRYLDGTSMAAPQVTAAVSVAAMCFPEDTVAQRIQRILSNVDVKAQLAGKVITGGRLNLQRILDSDANAMPDWWEKLHFNHYTGTLPDADADQDDMSNLNEFLGGTLPTNSQSSLKALTTTRDPVTSHFTLTWSAVPGKSYQVYYSPSLLSGSWSASLPSSLITTPAGETQSSYTDTTSSGVPMRFYRVQLVTP